MKVAVASDHRGFEGKKKLLPILTAMGHHITDLGCSSGAACDYPDFAAPLAQAIADGQYDVGILLDGTGIGMSIVANKIDGVRAALAHDEVTARRARTHNHCNVLCVGTDLISALTCGSLNNCVKLICVPSDQATRRPGSARAA